MADEHQLHLKYPNQDSKPVECFPPSHILEAFRPHTKLFATMETLLNLEDEAKSAAAAANLNAIRFDRFRFDSYNRAFVDNAYKERNDPGQAGTLSHMAAVFYRHKGAKATVILRILHNKLMPSPVLGISCAWENYRTFTRRYPRTSR